MTADVNVVIDHSEYTILVVDDVVSNVLLLKVLLTNEKFKVLLQIMVRTRWCRQPKSSLI